MSEAFPKYLRLTKRSEYRRIHRQKRVEGAFVSIQTYRSKQAHSRLGITVSKRFGKAHMRNRFKRLVREAFRKNRLTLPEYLWIHVTPKKGGSYGEISSELISLCSSI